MKVNTHRKLWTKIRDFIRSKTNNSDNYDQKYMKIKFDLDNDLLLKKTLELRNTIVVVWPIFMTKTNTIHKSFLDECLYKS